jgi:hypothetical protein
VLKKDSALFTKLSMYGIESIPFKELCKYSIFYKERFIKVILSAMKYYTKMYKKQDNDQKCDNHTIRVIEEMIFRLYVQLFLI